jgi:hypothetical protein
MWLNQPDANHYQTLELTVVKRPTQRWDLTGSFLATKNYRWIVGIPQSPNDQFNRLDQTWGQSAKLVASYWLPHRVQVGAVYQFVSGQWTQRTYQFPTVDPAGGRPITQSGTVTLRLDPFGAERYPAQSVLNFRVAKQWEFAGNTRFKLAVDVFNALNSNAALTTSYASGPTYGAISSITPPRIARLTASCAF